MSVEIADKGTGKFLKKSINKLITVFSRISLEELLEEFNIQFLNRVVAQKSLNYYIPREISEANFAEIVLFLIIVQKDNKLLTES